MKQLNLPSFLFILLHFSAPIRTEGNDCDWTLFDNNPSYIDWEDRRYDVLPIDATLQHPPSVVVPILGDFLAELTHAIKRPVFQYWCDGSTEIYALLNGQYMLIKEPIRNARLFDAAEFQTVVRFNTTSLCRAETFASACTIEHNYIQLQLKWVFRAVLDRMVATPTTTTATSASPSSITYQLPWLLLGICLAMIVAAACFMCCKCCRCCSGKKANSMQPCDEQIEIGSVEKPQQVCQMTSLTLPSFLLILLLASVVNSAIDDTGCRWIHHGNSSFHGDVRGIVQLNGTLPYPPAIVEPILNEFLTELSSDLKRRVYIIECDGYAEIYAMLGEQRNKTMGNAQAYAEPEYQTDITLYTESRCQFQSEDVCSREQAIFNPKVQKAFETILGRTTPSTAKLTLSTNIDEAVWLVAGIFAALTIATCCMCCVCSKYCCCKKAEDSVEQIGYVGCVEEQQENNASHNQEIVAEIGYVECVECE